MDPIKRSSIIFAVVVVLGAAGFAWSKTASFPFSKTAEHEQSKTQEQEKVDATSSATDSENTAIQVKDTDDDDKQVGKEREREDQDDKDDDDDGKVAGTPQTTPPPVTTTGKSYTVAQVATHNSQSSCWSIVDTNVYDLTSWIGQHPGGESAILSMCGKDGSSAFHGQHGNNTKQASILATMKIGVLVQ